jgi:hypothetical protein
MIRKSRTTKGFAGTWPEYGSGGVDDAASMGKAEGTGKKGEAGIRLETCIFILLDDFVYRDCFLDCWRE